MSYDSELTKIYSILESEEELSEYVTHYIDTPVVEIFLEAISLYASAASQSAKAKSGYELALKDLRNSVANAKLSGKF